MLVGPSDTCPQKPSESQARKEAELERNSKTIYVMSQDKN